MNPDFIIYMLVRGTLRTKPGMDLTKCYAPGYDPGFTAYGERVTGGGTVALLSWREGGKERFVLYDGGDIGDESKFRNSLTVFDIDPTRIEYALISHGMPDHMGLLTHLRDGVPWFFDEGEDLFRSIYEETGYPAQFRSYYEEVFERAITPDKFIWLSVNQIRDNVKFPPDVELKVLDGEVRGFLGIVSRRPVEIRLPNSTSYITDRPVTLVSDTIMSRGYLERLQSGEPEEALLGISMYPPKEARIIRQNNIEEMRRLLQLTQDGGILIPGHDDPIIF